MNILLFVHQREDYFKYRKELKRYIEERGHTVYVLIPSGDSNADFAGSENDDEHFFHYHYQRSYLAIFGIIKNYFQLRKLISRHKFDLVISFKFYPNVITGMMRAWTSLVRSVSIVAGRGRFASASLHLAERIVFKCYLWLLEKNNAIIVQNNEDQAFFKSALNHTPVFKINGSGASLDKEIIRFNELSEEELLAFKMQHKLPVSDRLFFLFSSRIVKEKGILELIKAFNSENIDKSVHLCIAGWFDSKQIEGLVMEGIKDAGNISYIGNHRNIVLPMAVADIAILPTVYGEGVPRSLIEALAFGKPVITSDMAGCNEIVDEGVNGYFVDPLNVKSILNAINTMALLTESERKNMSAESVHMFKQKFEYHIVYDQFTNILESI